MNITNITIIKEAEEFAENYLREHSIFKNITINGDDLTPKKKDFSVQSLTHCFAYIKAELEKEFEDEAERLTYYVYRCWASACQTEQNVQRATVIHLAGAVESIEAKELVCSAQSVFYPMCPTCDTASALIPRHAHPNTAISLRYGDAGLYMSWVKESAEEIDETTLVWLMSYFFDVYEAIKNTGEMAGVALRNYPTLRDIVVRICQKTTLADKLGLCLAASREISTNLLPAVLEWETDWVAMQEISERIIETAKKYF